MMAGAAVAAPTAGSAPSSWRPAPSSGSGSRRCVPRACPSVCSGGLRERADRVTARRARPTTTARRHAEASRSRLSGMLFGTATLVAIVAGMTLTSSAPAVTPAAAAVLPRRLRPIRRRGPRRRSPPKRLPSRPSARRPPWPFPPGDAGGPFGRRGSIEPARREVERRSGAARSGRRAVPTEGALRGPQARAARPRSDDAADCRSGRCSDPDEDYGF